MPVFFLIFHVIVYATNLRNYYRRLLSGNYRASHNYYISNSKTLKSVSVSASVTVINSQTIKVGICNLIRHLITNPVTDIPLFITDLVTDIPKLITDRVTDTPPPGKRGRAGESPRQIFREQTFFFSTKNTPKSLFDSQALPRPPLPVPSLHLMSLQDRVTDPPPPMKKGQGPRVSKANF